MRQAFKTAVAAGAVGVLALTGCGVLKANALKADNAAALSHLTRSRALSLTWRLDDPDGSLTKAATHTKKDPLTAGQAAALLGGSVTVTVSRNSPGSLFDGYQLTGAAHTKPSVYLKQVNLEVITRMRAGVLSDVRLAGGTLYFRTDWAAMRQVAELDHPGGAAEMDRAFSASSAGDMPELSRMTRDLRAGKWLRVPLGTFLDQLSDSTDDQDSQPRAARPSAAELRKLLDLVKASVKPHVTWTDLNHSGAVRTVGVDVRPKEAAAAAWTALFAHRAAFPFMHGVTAYDPKHLADLSNAVVHGALTIDHGHYTRLRLPFGDLLALKAHPAPTDPKPAELGKSAVLLDIADAAAPVVAPAERDISSVNVATLIEGFMTSIGEAFQGTVARNGLGAP
jgi:hypothetical protein